MSEWRPGYADPDASRPGAPGDCPATNDEDVAGIPWYCTRDADHPMPHAAAGRRTILATWTEEPGSLETVQY